MHAHACVCVCACVIARARSRKAAWREKPECGKKGCEVQMCCGRACVDDTCSKREGCAQALTVSTWTAIECAARTCAARLERHLALLHLLPRHHLVEAEHDLVHREAATRERGREGGREGGRERGRERGRETGAARGRRPSRGFAARQRSAALLHGDEWCWVKTCSRRLLGSVDALLATETTQSTLKAEGAQRRKGPSEQQKLS
eukprot:6189952-Pleurochrysis_carterae.AAC.1